MVTATIKRGTLHIAPALPGNARPFEPMHPTAPVDDLLGLLTWREFVAAGAGEEDDDLNFNQLDAVRNLARLAFEYAKRDLLPDPYFDALTGLEDWKFWLWLSTQVGGVSTMEVPDDVFARYDAARDAAETAFQRLDDKGVPTLFLEALKTADDEGRISAELAPALQRVRFLGPSSVLVEDWLTLATWVVSWLASRKQDWSVADCAYCGRPFVQLGTAKYCRRSPWGATATCQELGKARDYRERKKGESRGSHR